MKINRESSHSITNIVLNDFKHRPTPLLAFRKKFIGTHPILCVIGHTNLKKSAYWARQLYKQFDISALAFTELNPLITERFVNKHNIQSVIVFQFNQAIDGILVESHFHYIEQFLEKLKLPPKVTVVRRNASKTFINHSFITTITFGSNLKATDYYTFFDFFIMFVPIHIRLSDRKGDTQIVKLDMASPGPPMPLNKVALHPDYLKKLNIIENEQVLILNTENNQYSIGITSSNQSVQMQNIRLSVGLRNKLQVSESCFLIMHPLKKLEANTVVVQKLNHLQDETVFLSSDLFSIFKQYTASHYEIVNPLTGASYDLQREKFKEDPTLKNQSIRLNYITREFLDYEQPPNSISNFYLNWIEQNSNLSEKDKQFILSKYKNNVLELKETFEHKSQIKNILKKSNLQQVDIYPLPKNKREPKQKLLLRIWDSYLKWTIRPASINLKVIRPYSTDESTNIVRITKNAMSLLGINENDLITIMYRQKSVTVPVLELDCAEWIRETNILPNDAMMNIAIGIPASLRAKLGMKKIGVVCNVNRNLPYLFKKHSNMQFIPIVATVIAIFALAIPSIWLKILCIASIIPLAIYISLSPVREKIPKV